MNSAGYWINTLELQPHPEGGHYRETYRAGGRIPATGRPGDCDGPRAYSTAIYFLLQGREISSLHRLKSDELWHFYTGATLTLHLLDPRGGHHQIRLGDDPTTGSSFQACIPAGTWFGAMVDDPASFTLVGCTVAPGFDFTDFELGRRQALRQQFPQHADIIKALTLPE